MSFAKTQAPLANAEKAAQKYSDSQAVGATTMPCPNKKVEKEVIKVKVVGEDGVGLGDIALLLSRDDKQVLTGKTAPDGVYAFKGLDAGSYQLSLPELDKDAWKELETKALVGDEGKSSSVASWQSAAAPTVEDEKIHIIKQGECVGKIAEVYGFFPKTIWDYGKNAELKALRHENMYILFEKDQVVIAVKRQNAKAVTTGSQLTLQRQGIPESLNIQFLNYYNNPRVGVPYLVSVRTNKNEVLLEVQNNTDVDGFVRLPISPSAAFATIYLGKKSEQEVHTFNLGHVDPIDILSGVKARLNNLGYDCGVENQELNDKTVAAIKAFQNHCQLQVTGEHDVETLKILRMRFGS